MLAVFFVLVALQQPTDFARSESSYVFGERWDFTVTRGDLDSSLRWTELRDDPPLSPRQAIRAAETRLATLVADPPNWRLSRVSINPTAVKDVWLYVAEFHSLPPGVVDGPTLSLRLVVLMSGIAVEPTRRPWPETR